MYNVYIMLLYEHDIIHCYTYMYNVYYVYLIYILYIHIIAVGFKF